MVMPFLLVKWSNKSELFQLVHVVKLNPNFFKLKKKKKLFENSQLLVSEQFNTTKFSSLTHLPHDPQCYICLGRLCEISHRLELRTKYSFKCVKTSH